MLNDKEIKFYEEKATAGDIEAYSKLLSLYRKSFVLNAAYGNTYKIGIENANDMYSDIVLDLISNKSYNCKKSSFVTFIGNCFKRQIQDHLRKRKSFNNIRANISNNLDQLKKEEKLNKHDLEENEISTYSEKINEKYKETFNLRIRGLEYKNIAVALNIPIGTVKSNIHHATVELRDIYSKSNEIF